MLNNDSNILSKYWTENQTLNFVRVCCSIHHVSVIPMCLPSSKSKIMSQSISNQVKGTLNRINKKAGRGTVPSKPRTLHFSVHISYTPGRPLLCPCHQCFTPMPRINKLTRLAGPVDFPWSIWNASARELWHPSEWLSLTWGLQQHSP